MLVGFDYSTWLSTARRLKASHFGVIDAEDLLQEAIVVAIRAGRTDFRVEETRKWFAGALRNVARQASRSAKRRTDREKRARDRRSDETPELDVGARSLGRTNRRLATLLLAGMNRAELAQALGTSEAALRQRMVVLRRAIGRDNDRNGVRRLGPPASFIGGFCESVEPAGVRQREVPTGLIRRTLIRAIGAINAETAVGTHDPDGHPIVVSKRKS